MCKVEEMMCVVGPRSHSLHEVGLLQTSSQIVSTQSLPPELGPDSVFWASRPSLPAAWLALLLTKVGDVESNPGPTTHTPVIWICELCHKQINKKQTSIRCNNTHWVHLKCTNIFFFGVMKPHSSICLHIFWHFC